MVDAVQRRAVAEQAGQLGAFFRVDLVKALGQFAGIRAIAGQQAHGAEDADLGLALVQIAAGLLAHGLQTVEVDVDGQGGDDLVGGHQREHDAGHQHLLTVDLIEVGLDHTDLAGGARAHRPSVGRFAAGANAGVVHVAFWQGHGGQLARGRLRPVQGEAAFLVAAQVFLVDEQRVLVVQRVGFEYQRQAEQVGVGLQCGAHLAGHVFAQVEGIEKALFGLLAQEQHLAREAGAVLVGIHELATNVQRLDFALGFNTPLGRFGEHLHAAGLDQLRAVLHAVQRESHQQGDDAGQAQAGEQGDLPLNGKLSERHGEVLRS
uniref:Uncharacterized protein n=1 Tax=Pseudomonas fluorescens TaxID=294 RepID=A0A5E6XIQ1_PSEFL|nr:hypothetical protein PS652_05404 [Pseudomonas fluorescens]